MKATPPIWLIGYFFTEKPLSFSKNKRYNTNTFSQVDYLESSIERSEKNCEFTKLTKIRIQKIINICKRNTQQNEEWIRVIIIFDCEQLMKNIKKIIYFYQSLSYLLQNFHKLIKWEEQDIRKVREDIVSLLKIYDVFVSQCGEKRQNHMNLIQEIRRNLEKKQILDEQFTKSKIFLLSFE